MAGDYLSKDTFELWASSINQKLEKVDVMAQDVAVLKDRSNREDAQVKRTSSVVAAAVSGAVSAMLGAFFHWNRA
jgi:hypothetical protein